MQEAIYVFTSLREFNVLRSAGIPICPLPEDGYPIRYYGAYGFMKMETMDEDVGFCVYRAEGEWMYGRGEGEGWIDGHFDVADYPDYTLKNLSHLRMLRGARMGLDDVASSGAEAYFRMVGRMRR
jgi:hypothetical protein